MAIDRSVNRRPKPLFATPHLAIRPLTPRPSVRPAGRAATGSAAASSMVTPRKPAPNSSLRTTSRVGASRPVGDQHRMRVGGDEMLGDVVERAGIQHDVVVDAHQRVDGHGQPRRMQHRGIRPARSAADDLHARHPVLADDLAERCGADGEIAQARLRTDRPSPPSASSTPSSHRPAPRSPRGQAAAPASAR